MSRKLILTIATAATVAVASLASQSAEAHGGFGGFGGGRAFSGGRGFGGGFGGGHAFGGLGRAARSFRGLTTHHLPPGTTLPITPVKGTTTIPHFPLPPITLPGGKLPLPKIPNPGGFDPHHHWVFHDGKWSFEADIDVAVDTPAVVPVAVAPVPAPQTAQCGCLTKTYTPTGLAVFADSCTKESASAPVNSAVDATQTPTSPVSATAVPISEVPTAPNYAGRTYEDFLAANPQFAPPQAANAQPQASNAQPQGAQKN